METQKLQATVHSAAPLGQKSPYPKAYDKSLLFPVQRSVQRQVMGFPDHIVLQGFDVWNAYELFWLNSNGKPVRCMATFIVPANSPCLAEAKSVKLYLNSLNHERFGDTQEVQKLIAKDLSEICQGPVQVMMASPDLAQVTESIKYKCLDDLDIAVTHYTPAPQLLRAKSSVITEQKLMTHLFKSHCLVTGQPDLGSIFIDYTGPQVDEEGMLSYLVSYRDHIGFSENCIEQIFVDITTRLQPQRLVVFGRFTRRGGIDINPYRASHEIAFDNMRLVYQ